MTTRRIDRASATILIATAFISAGLLLVHLDHVPTWDGWVYAQCIADVGRTRFSIESLRCAEHISYSSMAFSGAFQLLSPGSFPLILLASSILYVLACAAVLRIAELTFPGPEHTVERSLLVMLVALNPAILSAVVQPNIDISMLPTFLWSVVFIVRRRWLALVLTGTALVLAKESGVLLYGVLVFSFTVAMVLPGPKSTRSPIRALLELFPLGFPVVVFASILIYRILTPHTSVLTAAGTTDVPVLYQFLVPRIDPYFVSYLAIIFVLSFAWIAWLVIALDFAVGLFRRLRQWDPRVLPGAKRRVVRFIIVLGLITVYALTRYSSYANTRYLLPVFALVPVMMYAALTRLGALPRTRRSLLGVLAVLTLISTVVTADPVSRAAWGTFRFGRRSMLRMTHFTRECCGAGQDQLAYSLQWLVLPALIGDVASRRVNDSTAIVVPPRMSWYTVNALDSTTNRPTLQIEHAFAPVVLHADSLTKLASLPPRAVYVGLPNGDVDRGLEIVRQWYDVDAEWTARRGRYSLPSYALTLRVPRP